MLGSRDPPRPRNIFWWASPLTTQWRQRYNHEKGRNDIVEVSNEAELTWWRPSIVMHCTKLAQNGFPSSAIIHPIMHARTTTGAIRVMFFVITVLPPNCFAVLRRTVMLLVTIQQNYTDTFSSNNWSNSSVLSHLPFLTSETPLIVTVSAESLLFCVQNVKKHRKMRKSFFLKKF